MRALGQLVIELRRRRVFRVAGLYVVGAWVLLQVADLAFQSLGIPDRTLIWVWLAAAAGFPLALVFGWRYDLTADGIQRTPPAEAGAVYDASLRRADYVILAALGIIAIVVGARLGVEIGDVDVIDDSAPVVSPFSLAVLPLENLSGDPDQAYFVDGMHETLIADLARISGLKVISRTSSEQFRDTTLSAREIGATLAVANLIEGSVQRQADQVRVNVQLIDTASETSIWSESFNRSFVDVLQLQSDIARAIASHVRVTLTPYEDSSLDARTNIDPKAYELYLKGRFHWYRFGEHDLELALDYFEQAIETDPDYALAYVGFADALATPAHLGMMPTGQVFPAASGYVDRALQLDPDLAEAHDMRARIHFAYDWDWDAADREFRRAISLNPGYPDAHIVYSQFLAVADRWDESIAEVRAGLELDPLNPWFRLELAERHYWLGDVQQGVGMLRELAADQPDFFGAWESLWDVEYRLGNEQASIDAAARLFEIYGEENIVAVIRDQRDALDYRSLMARVAETLESDSTRPYVGNVDKARAWLMAGDETRALDYLEAAFEMRESALVYTIAIPLYESVRSTDRYQSLLEKMNFRY